MQEHETSAPEPEPNNFVEQEEEEETQANDSYEEVEVKAEVRERESLHVIGCSGHMTSWSHDLHSQEVTLTFAACIS